MKKRTNRQRLSSQEGFTLIEMMIVGVILAVLMLGFSSYMYQQAKQTKNQESKQTYTQLKTDVLDASSQAESISQSENLQFQDLGSP